VSPLTGQSSRHLTRCSLPQDAGASVRIAGGDPFSRELASKPRMAAREAANHSIQTGV
jgi:hypothetical protein